MKGYYFFYVYIVLQMVGKSVLLFLPFPWALWLEWLSSDRIIGELTDTVQGAKEVGTDECRVGQVKILQR